MKSIKIVALLASVLLLIIACAVKTDKQKEPEVLLADEIGMNQEKEAFCSCTFLSKKCGLLGCVYRYKCSKTGRVWTRTLSNNDSSAKQFCEQDCCSSESKEESSTQLKSEDLKASIENISVISGDENDVIQEITLTPQIQLENDEQCAGQWVDYYTYKNGRLYVLNIGKAGNCNNAYSIFKRCLGNMDYDRVYCGRVIACAPYTICL
jgi:hypothetical protein